MKTLLFSVLTIALSAFSHGQNIKSEPPIFNIGKPSVITPVPAPSKQEITQYYSSITATSGNDLLAQVRDLTVSKHQYYTVYDNMGKDEWYKITDYDPNNLNNVFDFYTQVSADATWTGGKTWTREHVWCAHNSNGVWDRQGTEGTKNWSEYYGGADMHHLRPTDKSINSSRSDSKYGDLEGYNAKILEKPVCGSKEIYTYGSSYEGIFEPIDKVKGDAARIIMYQFIHYNTPQTLQKNSPTNSNKPIGDPSITVDNGKGRTGDLPISCIINNPANPTGIADPSYCFDILLKWNKLDPVDQIEINRNNGAYSIQGNRNPFIDHPEYAEAIWGNGAVSPDTPDPQPSGNLTSITIDNLPSNTTVKYKDQFDKSGLKVSAHFDDNTSKDISNEINISSLDTTKLGKQTIIISYLNKTASFDVFVTSVGANLEKPGIEKTYSSGMPTTKTWSKEAPTGVLSGINWTMSTTDVKTGNWYFRTQNTNGLAFGKNDDPFTNVVLTTNNFNDKTITSVKVTTMGASKNNCKLQVKVGNKAFGTTQSLNNTADTVLTFQGNAKGELSLNFNQTSKGAIYIKNIDVIYKEGGGVNFTALEQAKAYGEFFLKETNSYCLGNNASWDAFKNIISNGTWGLLKQEYNGLVNEAKNLFKTSTDATISTAFERYNYIVNKYNNVENFINVTLNQAKNDFDLETSKSIIIVAVLVLGISGITLLIHIKKQKRLVK